MSEVLDLSAEARERAGKGASRAMRREGRVPAVIYGNKQEPVSVHVEEKVLMKLLHTGHFFNSVVMLDVAGKKIRTLPKDVQFHPVTDRPLHADFLRIGEHSKVTVDVPVHFKDEELSPGMKKGGVLNIVVHDLGLTVDAAEIPEEVVVSLKGLDVGGTIHLSDIKLPKGATPVDDASITIATLVAPSALKAEEAEAAEAAAAETEAPAEDEAAEGETPAAEGEAKSEDGAEG